MNIVYIGTSDGLAETLAERMGQEGNDIYILSDKEFPRKPKDISLHRFYRSPRGGESFGKLLCSISPDCVIFAGNHYIDNTYEEESDEDATLLARSLRTAAAFPNVKFILLREALDAVPVEDAMAISGNAEKRALLLKQLKKDLKENYRILLAAEQDEDSELAHYAAVAKTEIYRLHQTRWLEGRFFILSTACASLSALLITSFFPLLFPAILPTASICA